MTDGELQDIVTRACSEQMSDDEVAELARRLADSGDVIEWQCPTADLASTGGPSSLSTLLGPIFLHSMGWSVPKLAVPGRPAGGVDVMAQIPGYRTNLSADEVRLTLEKCGYVHFEAGQRLAPCDARLFRFRQAVGAQAVAPLVIASLLAKKVAVGVQNVGLDVRVAPHGNFGRTFGEAHQYAARFCRVAKILSLHPTCFLTDATRPYQPFIGRREALIALVRVLDGRAEGLLARHATECASMAQATVGSSNCWTCAQARTVFDANVAAQGGICDFDEMERQLLSQHHNRVVARGSGYIQFDLGHLRKVLIDRQAAVADSHAYPDPVGVVLLRESGQFVAQGDAVMTVRAPGDWWPVLRDELVQAVSFSPEPMSMIELRGVIRG